ncbi:M15 family metallopeptidase [Nocardioides sp. Root151]|uniref:M15 family metallopeptidase n=1 Tax=Nocardioides sp. Root151 TaxID=1736475 RepID=UPI00070328E3|nr:M15 family metallopeptidase [Nocardioides sp. Root151]KQZ68860.1 peptidase M15 [Nocardioides sp. Root151]
MTLRNPAATRGRRTRLMILAVLAVACAALVAIALPASDLTQRHSGSGVFGFEIDPSDQGGPGQLLGTRARPSLGGSGHVPDGTTVFDDDVPAVGNLDPDLLAALREAADDAADDHVGFHVNSGWRSAAYQQQLLNEAVSQYGSMEEASRWVATPETSAHVSGDAIDLGPPESAEWLADHGDDYGLCQIYRNEPWHFELRTEAADDGCPEMYDDPTQDPRMQQ